MSASEVRITDPLASPRGLLAMLQAYLELTKPRIVELLLITTVPAMIAAAGGWPGTFLVVETLIGGALSAGGANAINQYVDRDIDRLMRRTRSRPESSSGRPGSGGCGQRPTCSLRCSQRQGCSSTSSCTPSP